MADTKTLIEQAYSAFNKRNIDGALALMAEDVSWPKASEGGRVVGKEEIRAYWTRQWGDFDGHVEPLAITEDVGGRIRVRAHQLVKNLEGKVLSDSEVLHIFTVNNGRIAAMDLGDASNYVNIIDAPAGAEMISSVAASPRRFTLLGVEPIIGRRITPITVAVAGFLPNRHCLPSTKEIG
jgi:hypothetical protein